MLRLAVTFALSIGIATAAKGGKGGKAGKAGKSKSTSNTVISTSGTSNGLCAQDHHVIATVTSTSNGLSTTTYSCSPCAGTGEGRAAGDNPANGIPTTCDICQTDYRVASTVCTACATGTYRARGDYILGADTACGEEYCGLDESPGGVSPHVVGGVCLKCPAGTSNMGGIARSTTPAAAACFADANAGARSFCLEDEYVAVADTGAQPSPFASCAACWPGSYNKIGGTMTPITASSSPGLWVVDEDLSATTQCVFSDFDRDGVADVTVYPPSAGTPKSYKKGKLSESTGSVNGPSAASKSGSFGAGVVSGIAGAVVLVAAVAVFMKSRGSKQQRDASEKTPVVTSPVGAYGSI